MANILNKLKTLRRQQPEVGAFMKRFSLVTKMKDKVGHDHGNDGKFTSGGGGGAKPKGKPEAAADAKPDAVNGKPGDKAKGVLAKLGGKLSELVNRVPVVGKIKQGMEAAMAKIHDTASQRYGAKTAKAIMASGVVADAILMGGGALVTGLPVVTGVNQLLGIIPAFVLAEGKYQVGRMMGKSLDLEGKDFDRACKDVAEQIKMAFAELLDTHGDELAMIQEKRATGIFFKRFSRVIGKKADVDLGDETERINLIADILDHVFGDDAVKFFDEGKQEKAWDDASHPRGPDGRFMPKGGPEAVKTADAKLAGLLKGGRTPENHKKLAEHLNLLTVQQLNTLKKKYQISASGRTKKDLVAKLTDRLSKGRGEGADGPLDIKEPERAKKPLSLREAVVQAGGISRAKLGETWNIKEDFTEFGLLGVLSKSKKAVGMDDMAASLHAAGHIQVPEGEDAKTHLMAQLQAKAMSLHESLDKEHATAEALYYQELEDARKHADESEVAETIRGGEESGTHQGETEPLDESPGELADQEGTGEVGDFDPSEFDDAKPPAEPEAVGEKPQEEAKPISQPAKPAAKKPIHEKLKEVFQGAGESTSAISDRAATDPNLTYADIDAHTETLKGKPKAELLGIAKEVAAFVTPKDSREKIVAAIGDAIKSRRENAERTGRNGLGVPAVPEPSPKPIHERLKEIFQPKQVHEFPKGPATKPAPIEEESTQPDNPTAAFSRTIPQGGVSYAEIDSHVDSLKGKSKEELARIGQHEDVAAGGRTKQELLEKIRQSLKDRKNNVERVQDVKPITSKPSDPSTHSPKIAASFDKLNTNGRNFVSIAKLRAEHPELSKDEFDKAVYHLRKEGGFTASALEGRDGASKEELAGAINEGGEKFGYLSRREDARKPVASKPSTKPEASKPINKKDPQSLATALREELERATGNNAQSMCVVASTALANAIPGGQVLAGTLKLPGGKQDAHAVVKVGNHYIDVATDQYGGDDKTKIFEGKLPPEYEGFEPADGTWLMDKKEAAISQTIAAKLKERLANKPDHAENNSSTTVDKSSQSSTIVDSGDKKPQGEGGKMANETATRRSANRNVDAYRVGNVIQHDGEWKTIVAYNRNQDDQGSYEHRLTLRPATAEESKRGKISQLEQEIRAMGPDDERNRQSHDTDLRAKQNELRKLQGRSSVEEEASQERKRQEETAAAMKTGPISERVASHLGDYTRAQKISISQASKKIGIPEKRLLSLVYQSDDNAPPTAEEIEKIEAAMGVKI